MRRSNPITNKNWVMYGEAEAFDAMPAYTNIRPQLEKAARRLRYQMRFRKMRRDFWKPKTK